MTINEVRKALCLEARNNFYLFCCLMLPSFYKEDRLYLKSWCDSLQRMYEDKTVDIGKEIYTLSAPPRHGKSLTNELFCAWLIGNNPQIRIAVITYGETLSVKFSRGVRDFISTTERGNPDIILYKDIFPNIELDSKNIESWNIKGNKEPSFKTCTPGTSITGFGFDLIIIDDMVKDAREACNIKVLNDRYDYVMNTVLSRLEKKNGINKMIIVMTRWSKYDVIGQIQEKYSGDVHNICYKAYDEENDTMLCEELFSKKDYETSLKSADAKFILANYQQVLIDNTNKMYEPFLTYKDFDFSTRPVLAMIDIADRGTDYTCCIAFSVYKEYVYVKDIFYTQDGMNKTEMTLAAFLHKNNVRTVYYERNNGGDLYMRNVKSNLRDLSHSNKCIFKPFTTSMNKEMKIRSNASWCNFYLRFPENWNSMYNDFFIALESFSNVPKENLHDDAADCISMIADKFSRVNKRRAKLYL